MALSPHFTCATAHSLHVLCSIMSHHSHQHLTSLLFSHSQPSTSHHSPGIHATCHPIPRRRAATPAAILNHQRTISSAHSSRLACFSPKLTSHLQRRAWLTASSSAKLYLVHALTGGLRVTPRYIAAKVAFPEIVRTTSLPRNFVDLGACRPPIDGLAGAVPLY
jgi:hypothetical protein